MNSMEIKKQIAFHNNDSNVFVRKWSHFKNNLSQNLTIALTIYKKSKT